MPNPFKCGQLFCRHLLCGQLFYGQLASGEPLQRKPSSFFPYALPPFVTPRLLVMNNALHYRARAAFPGGFVGSRHQRRFVLLCVRRWRTLSGRILPTPLCFMRLTERILSCALPCSTTRFRRLSAGSAWCSPETRRICWLMPATACRCWLRTRQRVAQRYPRALAAAGRFHAPRHSRHEKAALSTDAGIVPPGFALTRDQLITELAEALAGVDLLIAHNVASLNKNLPLTAALHTLTQQPSTPTLILWHHDLAWTTPLPRQIAQWPALGLLRIDWPWATQVVI